SGENSREPGAPAWRLSIERPDVELDAKRVEHVGRVRDAVVEHSLEHRKAHVRFGDSRDESHDPAETVAQVIDDARVASPRQRMRVEVPVSADLQAEHGLVLGDDVAE